MTNIIISFIRFFVNFFHSAFGSLYNHSELFSIWGTVWTETIDTVLEWLQMVNFIVPLETVSAILWMHFQLSVAGLVLWFVNKLINTTAEIL